MEELSKQLNGIQIMLDNLKECISSGKSSEQCLSQIEAIEQHIDQMKADDKDHFGEEQAADLKKELGTEGDNNDTGTPYQSREEVPEQARELWDIMHALKDDPHDSRWED